MIVIARVKSVSKHVVGCSDGINAMEFDENEEDPTNPYYLEENETFF